MAKADLHYDTAVDSADVATAFYAPNADRVVLILDTVMITINMDAARFFREALAAAVMLGERRHPVQIEAGLSESVAP